LEQFNQHETLDKTINQNTPQANYPLPSRKGTSIP